MKFNFVLDVDGVMTTGQFLYSSDGKSHKVFGPHDSDGLKFIKDFVNISFITADKRGFEISKKRIVEDMGYPLELVSEKDRYQYFKDKFGFEKTIFMGDGIFDAPILKDCFFSIAPANARPEAKSVADFVTESKSGEGAVCDACLKIHELFLKEGEIKYKVLIPCAGIGSRLKELTKDKNKALVKVNGRETISYIIEKFSKDVEFVIALGFKGEEVKNFLSSSYPDRKFKFVDVNPFDGPGSSLGFSISCCKEYLQCPFIFIPNDAIILDKIPIPSTNYLGYASKRDVTQFRSLRINNIDVLELCEKGATGDVWPYIGLMGTKDYKLFWEALENGKEDFMKAGESGAARYMMSKGIKFKGRLFNWLDTGNLEDLKKTEERLRTSKF